MGNKQSRLEKYKLKYEYHQTPSELRKMFPSIRKQQRQQMAEIRKKAKAGTPFKELAKQYKISVQKVTAIVRRKR